ncbi:MULTISPECIES: hypothetical protein [Ferrimonas]|uniref:hypothetical protein n=1 Tax=Ferrimonas TaxID=44011 RepID=UPI0003F8DED9|nr:MULTISPECIES: hypothetical protein [Ferrimonas]USD37015.1 hypothetical protein J8Z22_18780 [Ferrimonas sp. SCSIO 43195]
MFSSGTIIAVVAIVMGCLVAMIESKHKSQSRASRGQLEKLQQELQQARKQTLALQERVEVLEKIVTDSGFDLKQEISRLG